MLFLRNMLRHFCPVKTCMVDEYIAGSVPNVEKFYIILLNQGLKKTLRKSAVKFVGWKVA